jgi:hypothetical protein
MVRDDDGNPLFDEDGDPALRYGSLPFCFTDPDAPINPEAHRLTFLDVGHQIIEHVEAALKRKDDRAAFRMMAKGERIVAAYVAEGFFLFEPFQQQLRESVYLSLRLARREFIRRALTCPEDRRPFYDEFIRSGALEGPGAVEDYEIVERHLDEGKALWDDLRRQIKMG